MPRTITQKIVDAHLAEGKEGVPGQEVGILIDEILVADVGGTMVFQEFEAFGIDRVGTEVSVNYIDHNVVQMGPENADDHRYLQTVCAKYGVVFSKAGNGICHQVHLERFAVPGKTLLGADSHTPTCGAMGMLAIGAGGLDVAVAMTGQPFFLLYPRVIRIDLVGQLAPWVSAKDVVLTVLERFGTQGNVGCVFEYGGAGVKTLSVPERATIANMGTECGVTTSVFPSDEVTRAFLRAQGRQQHWVELAADAGAVYERVEELDLGEVIPKVACPHSPGNVTAVREVAGVKVNQVCIGSCTNSSYRDLMVVAGMLQGRTVHPEVSVAVAPGSRQVLQMITAHSGLGALVAAGVRILESACGFCMGVGQAPGTDGVSVRTSNRNFLGRSGTATAQLYLVSPETAAAAALTGEITDPRDAGVAYPRIQMPEHFVVDDSLLIAPSEHPQEVVIYRGPHMGSVPVAGPLPGSLVGEVVIKVGDRVSTDHIVPGGSRTKYRSNPAKYAEFIFEVVDASFSDRAAAIRDAGGHSIIVGGIGYGQGSSREHAAMCPMYLGVRGVLAKSIERIHRANLINFGIIPLHFVNEADYAWIEQGDVLEIAEIARLLQHSERATLTDTTKKKTFEVAIDLSPRERDIILAGGRLPYVKEKLIRNS